MSGPYGQTALQYWAAGWQGVLPLPANDKFPPPRGFTGAGALMPSYADVYAWVEGSEGDGNIGLRLPPGVVGIDVDAYDGKMGGVTFAEKLARWGPLPDTWRLSSRQDGLSGIYFYTVPEGLRWPSNAGQHIDIIENRYRYAVTWPSRHPNGRTYEWFPANELDFAEIPSPNVFPPLPAPWLDGLTQGQAVADIGKVALSDVATWEWLQSRPGGAPCSEMSHSVIRINERLLSSEHSRHDTMVTGVMHLAHLAAEGHSGVEACLGMVRDRFLSVAGMGADARSESAAGGEWHRALVGAAGVALADTMGTLDALDPCRAPLGQRVGAIMPLGGSVGPVHMIDRASGPNPTSQGVSVAQGGSGIEGPPEGIDPVPLALDANHVEGNRGVKSVPLDSAYMILRLDEEVLRQDIREMARDIRETRKAAARWIEPTGSDLASAVDPPEIRWLIEDVLPVESNIVLTAQYKSGKTTLVLNLARALADGSRFLELYPSVPFDGAICLWNYEVSEGMFTRWAKGQGIVNAERIHMLNLRGHTVAFSNPYIRKWTVDYLRSRQTAVWVLDPFARAMQGDENSNEEVARFLDTFDEIKAEAGVQVGVIVTHTGRSEGASERSRGASRIDDWADVRWLLTSDDERCRYFAATGRDVETVPGRLHFDPLSRRLSLTGEAKPVRVRPGRRNLADEILNCVEAMPGMGIRGIVDTVRARAADVVETVRLLEQQKRVTVIDSGKGKAKSVYLPDAARALGESQ